MANSIQYAKIASVPSVKVKTNELAGRVRVAFAEYEASAEQSTITMFVIPNGARLLSGAVSHDALGGSTTLSVGYAAYVNAAGTTVALDVDAYKAAAASTAATSSDALVKNKNKKIQKEKRNKKNTKKEYQIKIINSQKS
jgi:hypothetical protein